MIAPKPKSQHALENFFMWEIFIEQNSTKVKQEM